MNVAYNMDCMEGMKQYPDKYFDLAVVDPPYGIGITGTPGGGNKVEIPFGEIKRKPYDGGLFTDCSSRERERENRPQRSEEQSRSVVIGGGNLTGKGLSRPKATTRLMTKSHQMQHILLNSNG